MSASDYVYDAGFFDYIEAGACRSARAVVNLVHDMVRPSSVLDVGCGRGIWLAEWMSRGVSDICGIDGSYLDLTKLAIPHERFLPIDLSQEFRLERSFGLVQSLEVAEHLPPSAAEALIDSLTRHGEVIMFSAAVPGQGGEHHINEQPLEYWRRKFAQRGYSAYDALRPLLRGNTQVEPWYRYNILIYASAAGAATLTAPARNTRLAETAAIPDTAPLSWRLRNRILQKFPRPAIEVLARTKHYLALTAWRNRRKPFEGHASQ